MYNRREYWHTVINAAMVFCWFLEIHYTDFHSSTVDSGRTYLLGGKFRVWMSSIELAGSVSLFCWHMFLFTVRAPSTILQGNQGIRCAGLLGFSLVNCFHRFYFIHEYPTIFTTMIMIGLAQMSICGLPQLGIDDKIPNLTSIFCFNAFLKFWTYTEEDNYYGSSVWILLFTMLYWHFIIHFHRQVHLEIYKDQLLQSKEESDVNPVMSGANYISLVINRLGAIQRGLSTFVLPPTEFKTHKSLEERRIVDVRTKIMLLYEQMQHLITLGYTYGIDDNEGLDFMDSANITPLHSELSFIFARIEARLGGRYPFYALRMHMNMSGVSSRRKDSSLLGSIINFREGSNEAIQIEVTAPIVSLLLFNLLCHLVDKDQPGFIRVYHICDANGDLSIIIRHATCINAKQKLSDDRHKASSIVPESGLSSTNKDAYLKGDLNDSYLDIIEYLYLKWCDKWKAPPEIDSFMDRSASSPTSMLISSKVCVNGCLKIDRYKIRVPANLWRKCKMKNKEVMCNYDIENTKNQWCLIIDSDPIFQKMYQMQREVLHALGIPYIEFDAETEYSGVGKGFYRGERMTPVNRRNLAELHYSVVILKDSYLDQNCCQISPTFSLICDRAIGMYLLSKEKNTVAVTNCRFFNPIYGCFSRYNCTGEEIFREYFNFHFARKTLQLTDSNCQKMSRSIQDDFNRHEDGTNGRIQSIHRIGKYRSQRDVLVNRLATVLPEATRAGWEASIHRCKLKWILRIKNGFDEVLKYKDLIPENHGKEEEEKEETKLQPSASTINDGLMRAKDFLEASLPLLESLRTLLKESKYMEMDTLLTTSTLKDTFDKGGDIEFLESLLSMQDVLRVVANEASTFVEDHGKEPFLLEMRNTASNAKGGPYFNDINKSGNDTRAQFSSQYQVINSIIADMVDMVEIVVWECSGRIRSSC